VIVEFKSNVNKEFGMRSGKAPDMVNNSYNITPAPSFNNYKESSNTEVGISGKFFKDLVSGLFDNGPGIFRKLPDDFFVALRFLETQDKAKVLARPSILTLNGNKASIDVSETQYFTVETGVGENHTSRFQPIKFGIQLDITPWISQSGQITAEITPNVSNSDRPNSEGFPNVSSRSITTTVRLNDGETLVLGGLIKNQESVNFKKIPILGSLPLIGGLFRSSGKTQIQSNLVVFITPHVVRDNEGSVDVEKEIEEYDVHDMNFIEKRIHNGSKRIRSIQPFDKKSKSTAIETLQPVSSVKDTSSLVIVPKKNTLDTVKVKSVPDTSEIAKKL
jgi:type II secretory pathway component GspD/PulD (secretin)